MVKLGSYQFSLSRNGQLSQYVTADKNFFTRHLIIILEAYILSFIEFHGEINKYCCTWALQSNLLLIYCLL